MVKTISTQFSTADQLLIVQNQFEAFSTYVSSNILSPQSRVVANPCSEGQPFSSIHWKLNSGNFVLHYSSYCTLQNSRKHERTQSLCKHLFQIIQISSKYDEALARIANCLKAVMYLRNACHCIPIRLSSEKNSCSGLFLQNSISCSKNWSS